MPRPLTRQRLDQMRCCDPDGEPQPLYMHGRCHIRASNKVALAEDILSVSCSECDTLIMEAEIVDNASFKFAPQGALGCPDHASSKIWTLYSECDMYVICGLCDKPVTVLEVRP